MCSRDRIAERQFKTSILGLLTIEVVSRRGLQLVAGDKIREFFVHVTGAPCYQDDTALLLSS
jgi:hypothetical protein